MGRAWAPGAEDSEEKTERSRVASERIMSSVQEMSSNTWAIRPSYPPAFKCGFLGREHVSQIHAWHAGEGGAASL